MLDRFGTELSIGDVVVQDRGRRSSCLRRIIDIDDDARKIRLGPELSYRGRWEDRRPSFVCENNLAKYFDQEVGLHP